MSHRRERSDSKYSELEDLKNRYYRELRDKMVTIRGDGKYFLCPYCGDHSRRDYDLLELERHASRIARDSKSASFRDKARHLGLIKYLGWYEYGRGKSSQSSKKRPDLVEGYLDDKNKSVKTAGGTKAQHGYTNDGKLSWSIERTIRTVNKFVEEDDAFTHIAGGATEPRELVSDKGDIAAKVEDLDIEPGEIVTKSAKIGEITKYTSTKSRGRISTQKLQSQSLPPVQPSTHKRDEERIVWPWMAIIANIPVQKQNGRYVSDSGRKMKDEWVNQGYNPLKVHPLWGFQGHSGFAIVEFNKNWEGFKNAMAFEKSFEMDNHGKRDWYTRRHKGDKLYGWLARTEEYWERGLIGKYLQKNGDLKTVSDIQKEDRRKDSTLMCNLTNELESKSKKCEEIKKHISRTELLMGNVMVQKEEMVQSYNEEMKKMQDNASDQLRKISEEHKRSKAELEAQRQELKLREKELRERQALNYSEKKKLDGQKKMNEMAIMEQKKADENMLKLAEEQKKQKELLHKKIIDLEGKLDQKQALELQIQRIRGAVEVMKHMTNEEEDMEDKKKLESMEEELREKEEEFEDVESLNQALIIKERKTNDELQEARKELINVFKDGRANICVKRMGDLDGKPFLKAVKRRNAGEDEIGKAMELCSLWDDYLRDPSWHPYKVVMVGGTHKEVLDENDEKLKELKNELGNEVYEIVTRALNEMNEYNPSGRYPVPALWNSNEKKPASLTEGIEHLLKQWKLHKGKRRRY
ncbi:hypothetical protein BUALT_Bualt02G0063800 [Buddleja alternifolia]|uniref:Factor of DNA methylation 4 n=1 Tax=Buddleja alternifolia TaxID=168488 RepID=A0AAV6Y5X0_9LAMI|nr:hypothetical protein BUALT_Bualt02G0063800 [Buddleja alternifolia]